MEGEFSRFGSTTVLALHRMGAQFGSPSASINMHIAMGRVTRRPLLDMLAEACKVKCFEACFHCRQKDVDNVAVGTRAVSTRQELVHWNATMQFFGKTCDFGAKLFVIGMGDVTVCPVKGTGKTSLATQLEKGNERLACTGRDQETEAERHKKNKLRLTWLLLVKMASMDSSCFKCPVQNLTWGHCQF
jgi:hypothetical protein